jgi:hypothetical protein
MGIRVRDAKPSGYFLPCPRLALARLRSISVRLANHLIDTMAQRQATLVAERTPSWSLGHA